MYYNVSSLNNEKVGSNRDWLIEPVNLKYSDLGLVQVKSGSFNLIKTDKGVWLSGPSLQQLVVLWGHEGEKHPGRRIFQQGSFSDLQRSRAPRHRRSLNQRTY